MNEPNGDISQLDVASIPAVYSPPQSVEDTVLELVHQALTEYCQSESVDLLFYPDIRFELSDLYVTVQNVTQREAGNKTAVPGTGLKTAM